MQTVLSRPHFDKDGVIAHHLSTGEEVHLAYYVAMQAMLGRWFSKRFMEGDDSGPHAIFVDSSLLGSPVGDPIAESAAAWLEKHATATEGNGRAWLHDFEFTYVDTEPPVLPPWISGVGQAKGLLACLHWLEHTGDKRWERLARGVVKTFLRPYDTISGVAYALEGNDVWFEEYPTRSASHILNCHMLSLIVLDKAARMLDTMEARDAFEHGWSALKQRISLYDKEDWSRYDLYNLVFLFIQVTPSLTGTVALGKVELQTTTGRLIAKIDAGREGPSKKFGTRLSGMDWGPKDKFDGRPGRWLLNRTPFYHHEVPDGGTNQNTYMAFEQIVVTDLWVEAGLQLKMEVFLDNEADMKLEFRDPRMQELAFRADPSIKKFQGRGWNDFCVTIPPHLIGRPLPRYYHRLHTELLGTLLRTHSDQSLERLFQRWHSADLYDMRSAPPEQSNLPSNLYIHVNSECNLACRMCDIGTKNTAASLSRLLKERGSKLDSQVLLKALREAESPDGAIGINLVGTEPLLYPEYPHLLQGAKAAGCRTSMTTNGYLLLQEAERLAESGLDEIVLSLDGPPAIHDEIRGCQGLFDTVQAGWKALRRACKKGGFPLPKLHISFTISFDNHKHIIEFLNAIKPMKPHSVMLSHLNFVTPEIAKRHNEKYPQYPIGPSSAAAWEKALEMDFMELFFQLEEARQTDWTEICIIPYCPTPMRLWWYYSKPELRMSRPHCAAPWACVQVLCDGSIAVIGRCFEKTMGNLANQSLSEVWSSEDYKEIRAFLLSHQNLEPCLRCCGSL